MNKADFVDWKRHPVTQVVFSQLKERVEALKDGLGISAGLDPAQDRFYAGAISAYLDMLTITYEEGESQ